jgi:drug/metabolite transporter (DMT)-like permease
MLKLLIISTVQCLFLVSSQIFLKFAVARMGVFTFSFSYLKQALVNWQLACSGISIVFATGIWMYILKHFDFSVAYPMISISYVFGMVAAIFVFHETVPPIRWIGVLLIMLGVFLVAKQ